MFKDKFNFKILNILMVALIAYIVILTYGVWGTIFSKIMAILMPFVIAFGIAFAFYPMVRKLRNKGLSNWLAVTIVVSLVLFIIVALLFITIPLLYNQIVLHLLLL